MTKIKLTGKGIAFNSVVVDKDYAAELAGDKLRRDIPNNNKGFPGIDEKREIINLLSNEFELDATKALVINFRPIYKGELDIEVDSASDMRIEIYDSEQHYHGNTTNLIRRSVFKNRIKVEACHGYGPHRRSYDYYIVMYPLYDDVIRLNADVHPSVESYTGEEDDL